MDLNQCIDVQWVFNRRVNEIGNLGLQRLVKACSSNNNNNNNKRNPRNSKPKQIYYFQHYMTKSSFSTIKLKRRKENVVYVNGGRVIVVMNI